MVVIVLDQKYCDTIFNSKAATIEKYLEVRKFEYASIATSKNLIFFGN